MQQYFDPPNTGVPLFDTWIFVFVVATVTICSLVAFFYKVAWKPLKEMISSVKRDTAVVREQTENHHGSSPNPNLRMDLDSKHDEILGALSLVKQNQDEFRRDLGGIREELRDDREEQRRTREKLELHIRDTNTVRIARVESKLEEHRNVMESEK